METEEKDPTLAAFEAVQAALRPLDPTARGKVISAVSALLEIAGVAAPVLDQPQRATPSRPVSLIELMQQKSPGTSAQRITLFAYYRDRHEGKLRFERNDLKDYFAKAKLAPPGNFDRDFVEAVRNGWIHEDGAESYVTSKGIEAVEAGFPGLRKYSKPTRKKAKKASPTKGRTRKPSA